MAQLPAAFDSSQHEDMREGFEPIPAKVCTEAEFLAHITGSELKDTKAKTGKFINFEFTLLEGDYKGRKIWNNINIINPNPQCVEIGLKELATICRACGKPMVQDTQELHAIPFLLKLKYVPAKDDWPAKNEPAGYKPASGAPAQSGGAEPAASATGKVPW